MRLEEVYRLALARGLTAKQAGAEFGVNHNSLAKMKNRFGFPSLVSEFEAQAQDGISRMTDEEIKSYVNVLQTKGRADHRDIKFCMNELAKRTKQDPLYKEAVNSVKLTKHQDDIKRGLRSK